MNTIPERDLAVGSGSPSDFVRVVKGGRSMLVPATELPPPMGVLSRLAAMEEAQGSGVIGYATKALMVADLAHAEGAIAKVTNDSADPAANNGEYRKSGGIGAGAWIKSAYDPKSQLVELGSLARNRGAAFPLRSVMRSGITSAVQPYFNNAILNVRVVGARPGRYYRLSYFKNGAALAGPQDGWIIAEYPVDTYAAAAVETQVARYTDPAPDIPRDGGIHTVRVVSPVVAGLEFYITVDSSQLPALGNSIDANSGSERPAWSWVIDPAQYQYPAESSAQGSLAASGVHLSADMATRTFALTIPMGRTHMVRLTLKPNGKNGLFNIRKVERAGAGNPEIASWSTMSDTDTDWLPPMQVAAAANGDGGALIYTGGNHGSDGSSGGAITATMPIFAAEADGRTLGAGEVVRGYVQTATFRWCNQLYGHNTITLARAVLNQWFTLQVTPHGVEVMCRVEALENITVTNDNGPQVVGDGFADSAHFYGGTAKARQLAANVTNSGQRWQTPDAWAMSLGSANGFLNAWMDRSFAAGGGAYVGTGNPYMRKNASSWKFYHAAVAGVPVPLATGESYEWRGGYAFSPPSIVTGAGMDSAFVYSKGAKPHLGWAHTAAGSGVVAVPVTYSGRSVGDEVIGATGLASTAAGYVVKSGAIS